jgi:hypothetical protein
MYLLIINYHFLLMLDIEKPLLDYDFSKETLVIENEYRIFQESCNSIEKELNNIHNIQDKVKIKQM